MYPSIHLSIYPSVHLPICRSVYLSIYLSTYLSIYLCIDLSIYRSIDLSIYLSIYLIYLSIYLSICIYSTQTFSRNSVWINQSITPHPFPVASIASTGPTRAAQSFAFSRRWSSTEQIAAGRRDFSRNRRGRYPWVLDLNPLRKLDIAMENFENCHL